MLASAAYVQTSKAYMKTQEALAGESEQRAKAEASVGIVLEAFEQMYQEFAPNHITGDSANFEEEEEIVVARTKAVTPETALKLERMLSLLDRLAEKTGDSPRLRREGRPQLGVLRRVEVVAFE